jgi:hypothetical protein
MNVAAVGQHYRLAESGRRLSAPEAGHGDRARIRNGIPPLVTRSAKERLARE